MFKSLALSLLVLQPVTAFALMLDRLPFSYGGSTVYEWRGSICERDTLPGLDDDALMIRIYTSGGYITNLPALKDTLEQTARKHLAETGEPATIVFGQCGSACIRLLARANKLAREGVLTLQVERGETAGFHGVSIGDKYDAAGSRESVRDMINEGMNPAWLRDHANYFELFGGSIKTLEYGSPELRNAGLIDAAEIVDAGEYRRLRSLAQPEESFDTSSGECPKSSGQLSQRVGRGLRRLRMSGAPL